MKHSPTHKLFPGNKKMRASAVQTRRKRRRVTDELECLDNITYYMFDAAQNKNITRSGSAILCVDLIEFERHVEFRAQRKNPRPREACGADFYTIFGLCNVPLHFLLQIRCQTKKTCFLQYHSDQFFGLAWSDSTLLGKTKMN